MIILGLDISTTCIGWCALSEDGSFMDIGHIDLSKEKNFYKKVDIFVQFLDYLGFSRPDVNAKIFVEEPLKMFLAKKSMAQTIATLQAFNAACRYVIYSKTKLQPNMIMAVSARKAAGIKVPKGVKGKETKQFILDHVKALNIVPEDKWGIKKTGTPKDYCFDQADAFVVALGGLKKDG
jgi:hypothetical protein